MTEPQLPSSANDPYYRAEHPDHARAVAAVQRAFANAYPDDSDESSEPASAAPTRDSLRDLFPEMFGSRDPAPFEPTETSRTPAVSISEALDGNGLPIDLRHPYWNSEAEGHAAAVEAVQRRLASKHGDTAIDQLGRTYRPEDVMNDDVARALSEGRDPYARDEDRDEAPEWRTKHRGPDTEPHDGAPLVAIQGVERESLEDAGAVAAELKMTTGDAQAALAAIVTGDEFTLPPSNADPVETGERLRGEWSDYDDRVKLAGVFVRRLGPHVGHALETSGAGNDPAVVRYAVREAARWAEQELWNRPALNDRAHPHHGWAVRQLQKFRVWQER